MENLFEITWQNRERIGFLGKVDESLRIPKTVGEAGCEIPVGTIGTAAFAFCEFLQSVDVPEGITSIGGSAFRSCYHLENIILPESTEEIGSAAFEGCDSLKSITLPSRLKTISALTFRRCSQLKSVKIPKGVTTIEDAAFRECSGITEIALPGTVTSVGTYVFSGCRALRVIFFDGTCAEWAKAVENRETGTEATVLCSDGIYSDNEKERIGYAPKAVFFVMQEWTANGDSETRLSECYQRKEDAESALRKAVRAEKDEFCYDMELEQKNYTELYMEDVAGPYYRATLIERKLAVGE